MSDDKRVLDLTAASALGGTEEFYADQGGDAKVSATQIKTFTSASPTLVTPVIGVATGTSLALSGTLTVANNQAVRGTTIGAAATSLVNIDGSDQMQVGGNGNANIQFYVSNIQRWRMDGSGHLTPFADNTYDLGGVSNTVRQIYSSGVSVINGTISLSGSLSAPAWTTSGIKYKSVSGTLTDTTSSGTVAAAYTSVFSGGSTIAATSATTFTNYYGGYFNDPVAGSNVTFTNKYALGADSAKITALSIGSTLTLDNNKPLKGTTSGGSASSLVNLNASDALEIGGASNTNILFYVSNTQRWVFNGSGHLTPSADNTYDLGGASNRIKDLYVAGNETIGGTLTLANNKAVTGTTSGAAATALVNLDGSNQLQVGGTGNGNILFNVSGTQRWAFNGSGHLTPSTDNTYDIGGVSNTIRHAYIGTDVTIGAGAAITSSGAGGALALAAFTDGLLEGAPGYVAGRYYAGGLVVNPTVTTLAVAANTLYFTPFMVTSTTTWTKIGLKVTAFAGNARLGIYTFANGVPAALVLDSGVLALGSNAVLENTISKSLGAGVYALAIVFDNTPTVISVSATQKLATFLGETTVGTVDVSMNCTFTYAALPASLTFGSGGVGALTYATTNTPSLLLRTGV